MLSQKAPVPTFEDWWIKSNPVPPGFMDDYQTGAIARAFKEVAQEAWDAAWLAKADTTDHNKAL